MDIEYKKLKFKARRGMLELDLILQKYLENHFSHMSRDLKQQFEYFMDLTDPELYDLLVNELNFHNSKYIRFQSIITAILDSK
jgi:antitoxin CptB